MGTLDPVLADVATRVGISLPKTASLLSVVLSGITETPGGLVAFLERFRHADCVEVVDSWLGGSEPRQISTSALENALSHEWIEKAASVAGLSFSVAAEALSTLLPVLIQRLTPGGIVPTRLPSDILGYVRRPDAPVQADKRGPIQPPVRHKTRTSAPIWVWPVLVVLALVLLGYWVWSTRHLLKSARVERKNLGANLIERSRSSVTTTG